MQYKILQLRHDSSDYRRLSFVPLRMLGEESIKMSNYECLYEGNIGDAGDNPYDTLEDLYYKFNCAHPIDFRGHSLSISDLVLLDGKYYYCDSIGFVEINVV